jgi:hypothetical protein
MPPPIKLDICLAITGVRPISSNENQTVSNPKKPISPIDSGPKILRYIGMKIIPIKVTQNWPK